MNIQETTCKTELLPHDDRTEKALIGCLLIESEAISEVVETLTPDVFYNEAMKVIYTSIAELYNEGIKPDLVTVTQKLTKTNNIEKAGGAYELSQLSANVASSTNIGEYAEYLHQLWIARRLAIAGMKITKEALDKSNDIGDTVANTIKEIENIAENTVSKSEATTISSIARQCFDSYQERKQKAKNGQKQGISTGISKLDSVTNGWKPGQLIILAARPAMGKSAMMLHFAKSAALSGIPVVIFSLEMGNESLGDRIIQSTCDIDSARFKSGNLTNTEEDLLWQGVNNLFSLPITTIDASNVNMLKIKMICRNLQRKGKCGLVLIDYLQLIDMRSQNKTYNREQEVSQTSRAAKIMAKELDIPIILLSQLSRQVEGRSDKMPMLSDLRESGAIEQDADIVIFIHRPEYYDKAAEKGYGELRIAKNRDGVTGEIKFGYNENLTQISNYGTTPF